MIILKLFSIVITAFFVMVFLLAAVVWFKLKIHITRSLSNVSTQKSAYKDSDVIEGKYVVLNETDER